MNAQVSLETIENAAAMANISMPLRDLHAMLRGEIKRTKPVIDMLKKLMNGEEVKEPNPLDIGKAKPIEAHEYNDKMHEILWYLAIEDMTVKQLSDVTGLTQQKTAYLMQLLSRRNRVRSSCVGNRLHLWMLYDDGKHKPIEIKTMTKIRKEAAEAGQKYYHGSEHAKCGNTLRLTSSGDCVECAKARDKNRIRNKQKQDDN